MRISHQQALALVWALVICGVSFLLHVTQFSPASNLQGALLSSLHAPGFGTIAVSLMLTLRSWNTPRRAYMTAAALSLAVGGISEFLQVFGPRDADVVDVVWDALGIGGFLGIAAMLDRQVRTKFSTIKRVAITAGATFASFIAIAPTTWYSYVLIEQYRAVPQLLTFESRWENQVFGTPWRLEARTVRAPDNWPDHTQTVVLFEYQGESVPGFALEPFPDWRGYSAVSFLAASGSEESVDILIRIRDKNYTRQSGEPYWTQISIEPDPARYTLSVDEVHSNSKGVPIDISMIASMSIFIPNAKANDKVTIDDIRLDR